MKNGGSFFESEKLYGRGMLHPVETYQNSHTI